MKPTVLVVTTVHWPDDTRIRERLIRTLATVFSVVYAAQSPGPEDRSDHRFVELRGGRVRRNLAALGAVIGTDWDILVVHDPELIVTALLARLLKRRPVVFDVHEDYAALAGTREWVPRWMRSPLRATARLALRLAEQFLTVTLAESGYGRLFRSEHPVFPNYPDTTGYPAPQPRGRGEAVYLGDVTMARGVDVAIEACARAGFPVRLIGRVADDVGAKLAAYAGESVVLEGPLPNPRALQRVAQASVGLIPLRDLPNYRDSQPTKLLEYLSLGVPVVASDLPGTRALAEGLPCVWLVEPGDTEGMAEAIIDASSQEAKDSAVAWADRIRGEFSWPATEVRAFYKALVSR